MEKAIFSITCTTCQARLAVRSEAAIGAILECPKCASMVHVVPPAGWVRPTQPAAPSFSSPPLGPPPLDQVAAGGVTLDLGPTGGSLTDALFRHVWLLWGAALAVSLAIACGLWWALIPRPSPESVVTAAKLTTLSQRPVVQSERSASEETLPAVESPAQEREENPVAAAVAERPQPSAPPADPKPSENARKTKDVAPTPSLATVSPRAPDKSPAGPDLFPMVAEMPVKEPAKGAGVAEFKKAPPAQVDVDTRLAQPLSGIELTDIPLAKAVDIVAAMSTIPSTLDVDAMMQLGVSPRDPISLRLSATTVGDALRAAAAERGLSVVVDNCQVVVTTPAEYREKLRKVSYTVADLTGDDAASVANLASTVRRLVAPESWQAGGGHGTIESDQTALVVSQTGDVHRQVLVFCEKLRNARQKPLRSRENPERFTLATPLAQARKLLDRPVSANFHEPTPLVAILAFLAEATGGDIVIDRTALAAADTSDAVETALTVEKQSLETTLTDLLRPLGLTFRAVAANTLQVTTKEAAEERLELEFYPIDPWLAKGIAGQKVAQRLKARVAASTWTDAGGSAEVCFDAPSHCLIVLQSQPVQATIERLLSAGPALLPGK